MSSLIETLTFTSIAAVTYDFKAAANDVTVWTPNLAARGSSRPKMQMHGRHSRRQMFDGLEIDHEGVFVSDTQEAVVAERDAFLAAILVDLTIAPDVTSAGVLTVKYLGWEESASADVSIDSYAAGFQLRDDLLTLAYQVQWRCDAPYFIGDESDNPVHL